MAIGKGRWNEEMGMSDGRCWLSIDAYASNPDPPPTAERREILQNVISSVRFLGESAYTR